MAESGPPTPVTCAGCGLLCDDVNIERVGDSLRLRPPCGLGAEWFSRHAQPEADAPRATIRDQPVEIETALARAAELLSGARRPLLHGFDSATVEDARAAVALADRLGAMVATNGVAGAWPGAGAVALRGASTATLGEIRDRSQVIVIWREDPATTHPRLLERLGFASSHSPSSPPADRTLVVVDDRDTATAQRADLRLRWGQERDLEALISLHALQQDLPLRAGDSNEALGRLLERLSNVAHAAFVHGAGLSAGAGGQRRALALHELVRALCHDRHVVTLALPGAAGTRGAEDVLAWQTGYGGTVDFASGHPQLRTATRPLVNGDGIDVSLCIEGVPGEVAADVTAIALSSLPVDGVEVSIRTAAAGVGATGNAHRLDGVPLALQAPLPSDAPTAAALLTRLLAEIGR